MGEPASAGKRRARLKVINPRSAGIDVSSRFHVVAVPAELDPNPVRKFSSFTKDLITHAVWMLAVGINTIAMKSTGIYWLPLYEILSGKGIDVFLVNARHAIMYRAVKRISTMHNGFSRATATAWPEQAFVQTRKSHNYAHVCASVINLFDTARLISNTSRRR